MKKLLVLLLVFALPAVAQVRTQKLDFTRHDTTATAYTAGDVVGDSTLLCFTAAGNKGVVLSAYLAADTINVANATFRLYLFSDTSYTDTTSVAVIDDNAAFTLLAAEAPLVVGYIDFTLVTGGTGSTLANAYVTDRNVGYVTKEGTLFGVLTATGAYEPKCSGVFTIRLTFTE